jgi:hypothetical protein
MQQGAVQRKALMVLNYGPAKDPPENRFKPLAWRFRSPHPHELRNRDSGAAEALGNDWRFFATYVGA